MKITELKGITKEMLKQKTLPLYKAFIFHENGQEMKVNENADYLALSEEAAVRQLLLNTPMGIFRDKVNDGVRGFFGKDGFNLFGEKVEDTNEDDTEDVKFFDRMQVTTDGDGKVEKVDCKNAVINFAVFYMDLDDLKEKDLVEGGMDYFDENGVLGITLQNKVYKVDLDTKALASFKIRLDGDEKTVISGIKLKEVK